MNIAARNNRLINYKRVHGIVVYEEDFPLTASLKVIRKVLAQRIGEFETRKSRSADLGQKKVECRFRVNRERIISGHCESCGGWRASGEACRDALAQLERKRLRVDVIASTSAGHVTQLASEAYRKVIADSLPSAATAPRTN